MKEIIFENTGITFSALWAAENWCRSNGYSCGSTDIGGRVAIQKGEYTLPQKVKNFDANDFKQADGFIVSSDFRNGTVKIQIKA